MTPEEAQRKASADANMMFDISERCIMKYMSEHLNIKPEELFIDNTLDLSKPDIPFLLPPNEKTNGKYLAFYLNIVPYDYKTVIPDSLVDDNSINYSLGFIYHAITEVFNAVLSKNINVNAQNIVINASFHMEMDDNNLTFYPVYIFPERRTKLMLENLKKELERVLANYANNGNANFTNEVQEEIDKYRSQYEYVTSRLNSIEYDGFTADKREKSMNESLEKNNRIGITIKELSEDDLKEAGFITNPVEINIQ